MGDNPVSFVDPDGLWDGSNPQKNEIRVTDQGSHFWTGNSWMLIDLMDWEDLNTVTNPFERSEMLADLVYANGSKHRQAGEAYNQQYYENNNRNSSLAAQNSGYNSKLVGKGMERDVVVENSSKSTDHKANELRDKVIESIRKSTPKYYGGSGTLTLIGGVGLIGGLTKISKASIGLRKVGEASETTLLSTAIFYRLGIRGFAPFKVWTPFGYARTWETILGRWTAPAGGSVLLYDFIENNNNKK